MPRFRLSLRGTMIVVAITSLPLAAVVRSHRLAAISRYHHSERISCCEQFMVWEDSRPVASTSEPGRCGVAVASEFAALPLEEQDRVFAEACGGRDSVGFRLYRLERYHNDLRKKYDEASRRPWLPVEPDPAAPQ